MDIKASRSQLFSADPESGDSKRQWIHWHKSFTTYLAQIENVFEANKFILLINHIDASCLRTHCRGNQSRKYH